MTPADLRALAERVERSQAPNDEIAIALGWRMTSDYRGWPPGSNRKEVVPIYYEDLNAIAAAWHTLRERGWELSIKQLPALRWQANGVYNPDRIEFYAKAGTLPGAWLALLFRCLAAEMEAHND